jgi:Fic family protein
MMNQTTRARIDTLCDEYRTRASKETSGLAEIALAELAESVYHSNAIENSTLTLDDTERILAGVVPDKARSVREIHEATNLAAVTRDMLSDPGELSLDTILSWHRMLLAGIRPDLAGRFRKSGEWVRVGGHVGANPEFVVELLEDALTRYHTDDQPHFLDQIARFHCEFEIIHPFPDGNGRIGRVLINQQLLTLGLPPIIIRAKNRQRDYYPLLERYGKTDDFSGMTRLLALLLQESLHKRLALLDGHRIIAVSEWARRTNTPPNAALNQAKRQTIPAFRIKDRWMIASS